MTRTLASLILFLVASPLWADIPTYRVGDKIILEAGFEADDYDWRVAGAQLLELDNGKSVAVWAAPGRKYDWDVSGALVVDGKGQVKRNGGQFEVTTEPVPPTPATLRGLVSDSEAKLIAQYLRTLASQVGQIQSAEHFWAVWNSTTAAGFPVRGNTKLDAALKARLTPAIEKKTGLSVELRAIADEFDKEGPEPPKPPVVEPTEKATSAVYVHEKDQSAVPSGVTVGLNRLNREKGITATLFEDDTTDGDGDVPDQYKVPLEAARQAGLPAFVVMAGNKVLRVVKNPQGELEIWEAVP